MSANVRAKRQPNPKPQEWYVNAKMNANTDVNGNSNESSHAKMKAGRKLECEKEG